MSLTDLRKMSTTALLAIIYQEEHTGIVVYSGDAEDIVRSRFSSFKSARG